MSRSGARTWAAILGFVLAAMGGIAWAQEAAPPPLSLTGRILFGYADLSGGPYAQSGPAATLETTLSGYWRDPRILEFWVKPTVTLGESVPGTEMGNAVTGFSAAGLILQGSSFPLTLTYSRSSSSFGEEPRSGTVTNPNQDVLSGAESKTTNSVFEAHWLLRFKNLPTVDLDYRDSDFHSDLPAEFGSLEDDHSLHNLAAHINYNKWGWEFGGRYQHAQYNTTAPDILSGGVQTDNGTTNDLGFTASKLLPLHSTLSMNADQTKSDFDLDGLQSNLETRNANITLASQPMARLNTTMQFQYSSNLQASEEQQTLAGAGISGITTAAPASPAPASTVPVTYLAAPYKVLDFSLAASYLVGHGFTVNGSVGEGRSPNSGTSSLYSGGLGYQHKWRSGWLSSSFSHSQMASQSEVASGDDGTATYSLYTQDINLNTSAVNVSQNLPRQFKLSTLAHVSEGTLKDQGVPYPYHDYGGLASVTRPVGQWLLTGSFGLEEIAANQPSTYNKSTSKNISFGAGYRGLSVSGGYTSGSGLALQTGTGLLFVTNPQVVSPLLGIPVLSSTTGTNLTGSYRSRRGRLMLSGYYYRFNYTADQRPATEFNMFNFRGSYKLRRLRLIAGFMRQSQVLGVGSSGLYETKLMYFQIERAFRLY